jgi:hypothetical protein
MINPHPKQCFWYEAAEKYGAPDIKYCEETICSIVSEPANTWSNLAIVLVGLLIIWHTKTVKHKTLKLFGPSITGLGIVSFLYHMSNNFLTQYFDFIGMYAILGLVLFINLVRVGFVSKENLNRYYLFSYIPFTIIIFIFRTFHIPIQLTIAATIFTALFIEYIDYRKNPKSFNDYKVLFFALLIFLTAFIFQAIDIKRFYCDPNNHFLQPHALWHYFNALGMGSLYLYYLRVFDHMRK